MQMGSASLKRVLPAVTGQGYDGLAISDGGVASSRSFGITYGQVAEEEGLRTREELLAYCGLDTGGMAWIVQQLQGLTA